MYIADTNDIYFNLSNHLMRYHNNAFSQVNIGNFWIDKLNGFWENTIFVGGELGYAQPTLLIVNDGVVVNSYSILNESGGSIIWISPESPTKAWLGIYQNNTVYYFDNGSFTKYLLSDSLLTETKVLKNNSGEVFAFGFKLLDSAAFIYSHKLINNNFQLLTIDSIYWNTGKSEWLLQCGGDILMSNGGTINYFDGNNWVLHPASSPDWKIRLGGVSKDTLYAFTYKVGYGWKPQIWLNSWWKVEKEMGPYGLDPNPASGGAYIKKNNIYFGISDSNGEAFLIIGRPAKTEKR
jgi:hypothetical protein